jgi:hypothetical protein
MLTVTHRSGIGQTYCAEDQVFLLKSRDHLESGEVTSDCREIVRQLPNGRRYIRVPGIFCDLHEYNF